MPAYYIMSICSIILIYINEHRNSVHSIGGNCRNAGQHHYNTGHSVSILPMALQGTCSGIRQVHQGKRPASQTDGRNEKTA